MRNLYINMSKSPVLLDKSPFLLVFYRWNATCPPVKKSTSLDSPVGSPLPAAPVSALGELLENLGNANDCWIYGRLKICGKSFISDKPARGYMMDGIWISPTKNRNSGIDCKSTNKSGRFGFLFSKLVGEMILFFWISALWGAMKLRNWWLGWPLVTG